MKRRDKKGLVITLALIPLLALFGWIGSTRGFGTPRYCGTRGMQALDPHLSERHYCIVSNNPEAKLNEPFTYVFKIVSDTGDTLSDFDIYQERKLHLIVMRSDLSHFQHVHPEFNAITGEFSQKLQLAEPGTYRISADFVPQGHTAMDEHGHHEAPTAFSEIKVGSKKFEPEPLAVSTLDTVDEYQVELTTSPADIVAPEDVMLSFSITKDGQRVTDLGTYLGAYGHAIVVNEGLDVYAHTHPVTVQPDGSVVFETTLPKPDTYKVFAQFEHQGRVVTTDFVFNAR